MPLTLEKLFSPTVTSTLEVLGEVVTLTWAPARYTGEMDELAERLTLENAADEDALAELDGNVAAAEEVQARQTRRNAATARTFVAAMLVSWDLMDGKKPFPFDEASLKKLPDFFVTAVFLAMSEENATDPTSAPSSADTSSPTETSERSRPGSSSSAPRRSSASRRGK